MAMTQKELERIAKTKGIAEPSDFDQLEACWPTPLEWRLDALEALDKLQDLEDRQVTEDLRVKEEAKAERKRKRVEDKAERERKKAEKKTERERKQAEDKAERKRRAAAAKSERERKANERERRAAERRIELQQQLAQEEAREAQLAATQTPVAPRAIGTIQISRNGLPTLYTPSGGILFNRFSGNNTPAHTQAIMLPTSTPPPPLLARLVYPLLHLLFCYPNQMIYHSQPPAGHVHVGLGNQNLLQGVEWYSVCWEGHWKALVLGMKVESRNYQIFVH